MISIQEDLARNIATALKTTMDPGPWRKWPGWALPRWKLSRPICAVCNYAPRPISYSVGRRLDLTRQSYEQFERAREIDPAFADAHAQAASFWKGELTPNRMETGLSGAEPAAMLREFNLRIGLAIDNARTETDRIRSLAERALVDLRWREAQRLLEQYLETRPNDQQARDILVNIFQILNDPRYGQQFSAYLKIAH